LFSVDAVRTSVRYLRREYRVVISRVDDLALGIKEYGTMSVPKHGLTSLDLSQLDHMLRHFHD